MKKLRFILLLLLSLALPFNTVLARVQPHVQNFAPSLATHHAAKAEMSAQAADVHQHQGLFGKTEAHVHLELAKPDCIKACQAMPVSTWPDCQFVTPVPLRAVLASHPVAPWASLTVSPLEDPPRSRA